MKPNKYKNKKVNAYGKTWDSKKELKRYEELLKMQDKGQITSLFIQQKFELQPSFKLNGKTVRAISYIADFVYYDNAKQEWVTEDTKGMRTKEYLLKKKMFMYRYGRVIKEI